MTAEVSGVLASVAEAERLRIVATLIRITGDWELSEDCFQDAVARALTSWPKRGIPDNPAAWLTTVSKNLVVDAYRRASTEQKTAAQLARESEIDAATSGGDDMDALTADDALDDDRLRLIFTCCHPALAMESRVALTLRTVMGLSVAETAHVFLTSEQTMQKRLVRARAKIRDAGIPYRVPPADLLPERTSGVLAVLYLLFTEGYSSGSGAELVRAPLAEEAIRLTRLMVTLMEDSPQLPEVLGLLALELFQQSRAATRLDGAGDLVLLEDQDRSLWGHSAIAEGVAVLDSAESARQRLDGVVGSYQLQAQIAAQHATAATAAATDFARIAELYARLVRVAPSPVVELNRAVAVALAEGSDAGLALLDRLDGDARLAGYHLLSATRADLLRRGGRFAEALPRYRRALELAPSEPERRFLQQESTRCSSAGDDAANEVARAHDQSPVPVRPEVEQMVVGRDQDERVDPGILHECGDQVVFVIGYPVVAGLWFDHRATGELADLDDRGDESLDSAVGLSDGAHDASDVAQNVRRGEQPEPRGERERDRVGRGVVGRRRHIRQQRPGTVRTQDVVEIDVDVEDNRRRRVDHDAAVSRIRSSTSSEV
ncbi:MAG: sigma-70 family RNA polymerase sigma factor [Pseudolysinimonas sp.]